MKKTLTLLLILTLAFATLICLGGCKDKNEGGSSNAPHTHTITKINAKAETCTENGNIEYYTCSTCGKHYADASATKQIALADTVIQAEHKYENKECTVCGEAYYSKGLSYSLSDDGTYYIVDTIGTCKDTDLVIPGNYNGLPVAAISKNAFKYCNVRITSVTIPDSVVSIGDYAFEYCALKNVIIGNGVTYIGDSAFLGCSGLENVTLGTSVTSIGSRAFYECSKLTSITIPDSAESIGEYAFYNCKSLTNVIIGNGVTSVGNNAFNYCERLASLTIGNNVASIGDYAFGGCLELMSITIPKSVTSIGNAAFSGCYKLVDVCNLSNLTITKEFSNNGGVGSYALNIYTDKNGAKKTFETTDGFVLYEDSQTCYLLGYIGDKTEITLPESCNGKNYGIYNYAFYSNGKITKLVVPNRVISVGELAFENCKSLKEVHISDIACWCSISFDGRNVTSGSVFKEADLYLNGNLVTELVISSTLGQIKEYTFSGFKSIENVTIQSGVTSIGNNAFCGCTGLKNVTIPDSVTNISYNAFSGCTSLTEITIPKGVNFILNGTFSRCTGLTNVIIPNNVTRIDESAFSGCTGLTSVTISDRVTQIGLRAFYGCVGITSITIPDSVTVIGKEAFSGCTSLKSVTFGNLDKCKWHYSEYLSGYSQNSIPNEELADTATAAEHLTNTYCNYFLKKYGL